MEAQTVDIIKEKPSDHTVLDRPVLRERRESDDAMIIDSWLRSGLQYPIFTAECGRPPIRLRPPHGLLLSTNRTFLQKILPLTSVAVLCDPEDSDHIIGWICYEEDCLHFIFVKYNFRRLGFANELMEKADLLVECEVSWRTPALNFFKKYSWTWNPYRSWR
jgi:GNAT superfamily N-acetyltransferase